MNQKPSIWRAWYPVVFQVIGIVIVCVAPLLPHPWVKIFTAAVGVLVYAIGFGYRKPS